MDKIMGCGFKVKKNMPVVQDQIEMKLLSPT
jgi:hypothetical protein